MGHHTPQLTEFLLLLVEIKSRRFTFVVVVVVAGGHCRSSGEGVGRIPGEEWEAVLAALWWGGRDC